MTRDDIKDAKDAIRTLVSVISNEETAIIFEPAGGTPEWHPATDTPPEGRKVVVVTNTGCVFFDCAINGRLLHKVQWWLELPELPKSI